MGRRSTPLVLSLVAWLSAAGCQHARYHDYAAFVREPRPEVIGQDYRLGVPDTVSVAVVRSGGTTQTSHTLGPDGLLRLPGLAPVAAAGRGCGDVAEAIETQIRKSVNGGPGASVSVRVTGFASQKIFVFGQVEDRGPQPYHGANSLVDVLSAARPNARADTRFVQVLRPSADGEFRRRLTVDFDAIVRRGDATLDVVLGGGDVVYVPPTALGSVGLAWEQLFGPPAYTKRPPAPVDHEPGFDAAEELERLHESLAAWGDQVQALEASQARLTGAVDGLTRQSARLAAAQAAHRHTLVQATPPPRDTVAFTTADGPRGGEGESQRPEGVRFWGP